MYRVPDSVPFDQDQITDFLNQSWSICGWTILSLSCVKRKVKAWLPYSGVSCIVWLTIVMTCLGIVHVDYICTRANARLHYLKWRKRAGLPTDRLAIWYSSIIRLVLEYCVVVWHHGLRKYQTEAIEASYSHYLSIYNGILGGVAVCWASVSFR